MNPKWLFVDAGFTRGSPNQVTYSGSQWLHSNMGQVTEVLGCFSDLTPGLMENLFKADDASCMQAVVDRRYSLCWFISQLWL